MVSLSTSVYPASRCGKRCRAGMLPQGGEELVRQSHARPVRSAFELGGRSMGPATTQIVDSVFRPSASMQLALPCEDRSRRGGTDASGSPRRNQRPFRSREMRRQRCGEEAAKCEPPGSDLPELPMVRIPAPTPDRCRSGREYAPNRRTDPLPSMAPERAYLTPN